MHKIQIQLKENEIASFFESFEVSNLEKKEEIELEIKKAKPIAPGLNLTGIEVLATISATNAAISLFNLLRKWLKEKKKKKVMLKIDGKEIELDENMSIDLLNSMLDKEASDEKQETDRDLSGDS